MSDSSPISLSQAVEAMSQTDVQTQEPEETLDEGRQEANADPELLEADTEEVEEDTSELEDDSEELESDDEPEEDEEEPETYTVVVRGEKLEVSLDELKKGYMLESNYTRSMQEAAEMKKTAQARTVEAEQRLNDVTTYLATIDQMFFGQPPQQPDLALLQTDPAEYERQKVTHEQWMQGKRLVEESSAAVQRQQQEEAAAKNQEWVQTEAKAFFDAFEDVTDEATMTAKIGKLHSFAASEYGYKPDELAQVVDHRAYKVLNDLMRYKEQMGGAAKKAKLKAKRARTKGVSADGGQRRQVDKRSTARKNFDQVTSGRHTQKQGINAALDAMEGR